MARSFFRKLLLNLSSEDELEVVLNDDDGSTSQRGRNRQRRKYIQRDHIQGHEQLFRDYFAEPPVYPLNLCRRRFRMSRLLFLRILNEVEACEPYFQKRDNVGRLSLSSMQKITAAIRMLAYGVIADFMDEYIRIGESIAMESLNKFVKTIVVVFSNEYLRSQNANDIVRLLAVSEQRRFLRMLRSIDCRHWRWKKCPVAWKCMYSGHIRQPTIILEAVASHDLRTWYAFFGLPSLHSDVNVLERSHIFTKLAQGHALLVNYSANGNEYTMEYYLADGICPKWSTFVKTIPSPHANKKKHFAVAQESTRKNVERAFGVFQQRFAIIHGPS